VKNKLEAHNDVKVRWLIRSHLVSPSSDSLRLDTLKALHISHIYLNPNKATSCISVLPAACNVLPQSCPCCQACMRAAVNVGNSFNWVLTSVQLRARHHQYDCVLDWAVHDQVHWRKGDCHEIRSEFTAAPFPRTDSSRKNRRELDCASVVAQTGLWEGVFCWEDLRCGTDTGAVGRVCSYRAVNTLRLGYTNQSVNVV